MSFLAIMDCQYESNHITIITLYDTDRYVQRKQIKPIYVYVRKGLYSCYTSIQNEIRTGGLYDSISPSIVSTISFDLLLNKEDKKFYHIFVWLESMFTFILQFVFQKINKNAFHVYSSSKILSIIANQISKLMIETRQ